MQNHGRDRPWFLRMLQTRPSLLTQSPPPTLRLERFSASYAATVANWVRREDELFWVAPSMSPPLTAEKVAAWTREVGNPFLLLDSTGKAIAYAELNPMREAPSHFWIGHLVLDPSHRGCGYGQAFVWLLLERAFSKLRARQVSLIVFPDNRAAIRCYLRAGFERQGEQFHSFGPRGKRYRMLHLVAKAG